MSDELDEQVYTVNCPKCDNDCFEEVQSDVVVSTKFKTGTLCAEDDFFDIDYGESENHGGSVDRYQCSNCGHVVAKTPSEFREWIKKHGKK